MLHLVLAFNDLMKGERFVEVLCSDGWLIEESFLGVAAISGCAFDDWGYKGSFSLAGLESTSSSPLPPGRTHTTLKYWELIFSFECKTPDQQELTGNRILYITWERQCFLVVPPIVLYSFLLNCSKFQPARGIPGLFKIMHASLRCASSEEGAQSL